MSRRAQDMTGTEFPLSPRTRRILDRLGRTRDPAMAQRLSQLLLLEEEMRCTGREPLRVPETDEAV